MVGGKKGRTISDLVDAAATPPQKLPLLIFDTPPEVLRVMLDDIGAELGQDAIFMLREAKVLGRVLAVLLECKCAGLTPNLMEAVSMAGVEQKVAALVRSNSIIDFTEEDFKAAIVHYLPAVTPLTAKRICNNNGLDYDANLSIFGKTDVAS